MSDTVLEQTMAALDQRLQRLERYLLTETPLDIDEVLVEGSAVVVALMQAYATAHGKVVPVSDDLLAVLKAMVKGDPSLNAVRDNVRELVYYRNCLAQGQPESLPPTADKMVIRTARHIWLYLHSRLEQDGLLS